MKKDVFFLACLSLLFFSSCKKEKETIEKPKYEKPKVKIVKTTNIKTNELTVVVLIGSDGNSKITDYGVVLSEVKNPSLKNNVFKSNLISKVNKEIKIKIKGLKSNTTYHIKPFAKNKLGMSYGDEISIKTKFRINDVVLVKGGTFFMGSNNEKDGEKFEQPVHKVTLKDFKIRINEVTNSEFATFLNANLKHPRFNFWLDFEQKEIQIEKIGSKYKAKKGKENYPVVFVRYFGAEDYATWNGGRLPTEAEFEYVAKGGNKSKGYLYPGSNNIEKVAWYKLNSRSTQKVAQKEPNELGVYDMAGNVWEWISDTWHKNYENAPTKGNKPWKGGRGHILRGGSWQSSKYDCRSTYRTYNSKYYVGDNVGFRVVYDIK